MSNKALDPSTGAHQFTFVGGNSPSKARSHAMREYWKQRHRRQQESTPGVGRMARELLPRHQQNKGTSQIQDEVADVSSCRRHDHCDDCEENDSNIAVQLLKGVSCALLGSRPDPFQTCPIHLTSQHQKLLHHWICTHAAMMFDDLDASSFNPMREVWFPLDLSNASSFNCIMAHSAAHLAHLYAGSPPHRGTNSSDALKYKAEAVRILNSWMVDPKKELSDDAFAAVVRLLTFERYWGNDIEWEIHRKGLQKMIIAKGGVHELHGNWRLELVVYLVSLMSRPSWLEPTNRLEDISSPFSRFHLAQGPLPSLDIQKVRCLWLISFIQDMRTFMGYYHGARLTPFHSIHTAIKFLHDTYQLLVENSHLGSNISGLEYEILTCLFTLSIILQEAISLSYKDPAYIGGVPKVLAVLETTLKESQNAWSHSPHTLQSILYQTLTGVFGNGDAKITYIVEMVKVLETFSLEARQGVEKCLLNLLYSSGKQEGNIRIDDGWTPDSLLSSMHGH